MPTAKAQYKGDGSGVLLPEFTDGLKAKLRAFYLDHATELQLPRDDADEFVGEILSEAWRAKSTQHAQSYEITKSEIKAELEDLFKSLHAIKHKLVNLSLDADLMLGLGAEPLACADEITKLLQHEEHALKHVAQIKKAKKPRDKQHVVAVKLAWGVLKVLQRYKMGTGATADPDFESESDVVTVLKLIGEDLRLILSPVTWRGAILKAKKQRSRVK